MSLTEALRAGAPEAFGALYDEYAAQLYAYCHIMVGDDAADAVRDAFIAAARHPGSAPADDDALPTWLHALARAECVRRGALTRKPVTTPTADPLRRALTRLRPEHREALALNAALRSEEIARVIGVARDTAEELVRVAKRRLEQAAASVGGREAHDSAMLAALSEGALHRLVTLGYEPPARQRERVLFSCAAAERAPDGALLFDADGMPIPLDGLLDNAESPTDPFTRVSLDEPATAPLRQVDPAPSAPSRTEAPRPEASRSASSRVAGAHAAGDEAPTVVRITHAKPKKEPLLSRRRDGLFEVAGIAACVAAATGVLALWPSPHQGGASNMDGTSLFLHRGAAASRSAEPSTPAGQTPPPQAATSKPGASPTPKPTTAASGAPATTPPPVTGPTADPAGTPPPNGGSGPGHPTSPPSSPPSSPTDSPTTTPTPDPTPTASDSPTNEGSDSPIPDPSGS